MTHPMSAGDLLWTEATRDVEAEHEAMLLASASVQAAPLWGTVLAAESDADFHNRIALLEGSIQAIASSIAPMGTPDHSLVVTALPAQWYEDWSLAHQARQVEAQRVNAHRAFLRNQQRAASKTAEVEMVRTRQSIHGQITDALAAKGIPWEWRDSGDGRTLYFIEGQMLTPGEAADKYLEGGFAGNFGGNGRTYAKESAAIPGVDCAGSGEGVKLPEGDKAVLCPHCGNSFSAEQWGTYSAMGETYVGLPVHLAQSKTLDDRARATASRKTAKLDIDLDSMLNGYLTTALWSSTGDDGEPLDSNYEVDDIPASEVQRARRDCESFVQKAGDNLVAPNRNADFDPSGSIGHDFWLTRNGHGAGFWDGDYPEPQASALTNAAKSFGETDIYVGDDGKVYLASLQGARKAARRVVAGDDYGNYPGWKKVPHPNPFPGATVTEYIPSCPTCGSVDIFMTGIHGPGGRLGDPGAMNAIECRSCGRRDVFPAKPMSASKTAAWVDRQSPSVPGSYLSENEVNGLKLTVWFTQTQGGGFYWGAFDSVGTLVAGGLGLLPSTNTQSKVYPTPEEAKAAAEEFATTGQRTLNVAHLTEDQKDDFAVTAWLRKRAGGLDAYWQGVDASLAAMRKAKSAAEVIEILGSPDRNIAVGDAFFGGDGDDMMGALFDAGWRSVRIDAPYYWCLEAPDGSEISYVEGDVFTGNKLSSKKTASDDEAYQKGKSQHASECPGPDCAVCGQDVSDEECRRKLTEMGKTAGLPTDWSKGLPKCPDCGADAWTPLGENGVMVACRMCDARWSRDTLKSQSSKTAAADPPNIALCRKVLAEGFYAGGEQIDQFSASAIVQVYDALNDANKAKFGNIGSLAQMADIAFKLSKAAGFENHCATCGDPIEQVEGRGWQHRAEFGDKGHQATPKEKTAAKTADNSFPPKDDVEDPAAAADPAPAAPGAPQPAADPLVDVATAQVGGVIMEPGDGVVNTYEIKDAQDAGDSMLLTVTKNGTEEMQLQIPKTEKVQIHQPGEAKPKEDPAAATEAPPAAGEAEKEKKPFPPKSSAKTAADPKSLSKGDRVWWHGEDDKVLKGTYVGPSDSGVASGFTQSDAVQVEKDGGGTVNVGAQDLVKGEPPRSTASKTALDIPVETVDGDEKPTETRIVPAAQSEGKYKVEGKFSDGWKNLMPDVASKEECEEWLRTTTMFGLNAKSSLLDRVIDRAARLVLANGNPYTDDNPYKGDNAADAVANPGTGTADETPATEDAEAEKV